MNSLAKRGVVKFDTEPLEAIGKRCLFANRDFAKCFGYFNSANKTDRVMRINTLRAFQIKLFKDGKELSRGLLRETLSECWVRGHVRKGDVAKERINVESRAAADDGDLPARKDVLDRFPAVNNEVMCRKDR